MTDLRTSLHRVADAVEPLPLDDDLWQRGVASRRRGQALVIAAVLAVIASVTWSAVLLRTDDREARTASGGVEGGAIPTSIIDLTDLTTTDELAIGRASVAFVSDDAQPIVVTARDGAYHALDLPGWDGNLLVLSPDGTHLSWTIDSDPEGRPRDGFALMDLESGDTKLMSSGADGSITPDGISWAPSSRWLTWFADDTVSRTDITSIETEVVSTGRPVDWAAVNDDGFVRFYAEGPRQWGREGTYERMKTAEDGAFDGARTGLFDAAVTSPDGTTVALASTADAAVAEFLVVDRFEDRRLATDLYPGGAAVRPLGWATDDLVLAQVDAPSGSYADGSHLALFTAPTRPEEEWTYRIVMREVPDQPVSIAVDLVPDLDGTASQELTHDFDRPISGNPLAFAGIEISILIGLGVAAAIAVLMALRWLWRRLLG